MKPGIYTDGFDFYLIHPDQSIEGLVLNCDYQVPEFEWERVPLDTDLGKRLSEGLELVEEWVG